MAFGEKLQEVRKQSGMTQETFAEQLHVSRQASPALSAKTVWKKF